MTLRWLITGAGGMVGTDLRQALEARGEEVVAVTKADLDITDGAAVRELVRTAKPSIIINCARSVGPTGTSPYASSASSISHRWAFSRPSYTAATPCPDAWRTVTSWDAPD